MADTADAPIAPAATVIVLRDSPHGPEVFLVRRHHAIAFMAGAHVFPGGRAEAEDRIADPSWCDDVAASRQKLPGVDPDTALAFQVAAARELFEEAGVLLARAGSGEFVSLNAREDQERFGRHRADLLAHRRTFKEILTGEGLRLSVGSLVHFAHWVTPAVDVRRFDTRFFVTRVPACQTPAHDDREATESVWMTPSAAIAAAGLGGILLPPPTWATLRELERFDSVDRALEWARLRPVRRREPRVIETRGVRRIVLPGDPSMPEPEPVAFETRFVLSGGRWAPEPAA